VPLDRKGEKEDDAQHGIIVLPLPAPEVLPLMLSFLHTGNPADLTSALLPLPPRPPITRADYACKVLANVHFLGLSQEAGKALISEVLVAKWDEVARSEFFKPDVVTTESLRTFLRELSWNHGADITLRCILLWAHRGGWGLQQSPELHMLIQESVTIEQLTWATLDMTFANLTSGKACPPELVNAAFPAVMLIDAFRSQHSAVVLERDDSREDLERLKRSSALAATQAAMELERLQRSIEVAAADEAAKTQLCPKCKAYRLMSSFRIGNAIIYHPGASLGNTGQGIEFECCSHFRHKAKFGCAAACVCDPCFEEHTRVMAGRRR